MTGPGDLLPVAAHLLHGHFGHRFHGPKVGYWGVAAGALLSWLAFTGPGEAALIAAAVVAARGRLDITTVIVCAWVGAMAGGVAGWLIGRHAGQRLFLAGRRFRRQRERMLRRGNRFFERYGFFAVYLAPSWAAGINAMSARRFLPANAVSGAIWALLIGVGAYEVGPSIEDVAQDIGLFGALALVALAIVVAVVERRRMRRRPARRPST